MKEYIEIIEEFTAGADELQEPIRKAIEKLKTFGPSTDEFARLVFFSALDIYADGCKRLESKHGFTRPDAIQLICNMRADASKASDKANKK